MYTGVNTWTPDEELPIRDVVLIQAYVSCQKYLDSDVSSGHMGAPWGSWVPGDPDLHDEGYP